MAAPFADYADRYSFSQSAAFLGRIQVALMTMGLGVLSESPTANPDQPQRYELARRIINDPASVAPQMAIAVCVPGWASGDDVTDAQVMQIIGALFSKFASK